MILMQLSSFDGEGMAFLSTCDAGGAYRYQWRGEWLSCPGAIARHDFRLCTQAACGKGP